MEFNAAERRIFAAIATTMVGEDAGSGSAEAVTPFLRELPKLDRRSLAVLLRFIEYGAPLLIGRLRRFTRLNPEQRAAIVRGWMESDLAPRRQAAASLKVLAMLGYYGRDAAWGDVGYDGPWLDRIEVPVLPAPDLRAHSGSQVAPAPGVTAGRSLRGDLELPAEVCVIGTGAAVRRWQPVSPNEASMWSPWRPAAI